MAVSVLGASIWHETNATSSPGITTGLPASAAGDRMYVFASWKAFSITATCASTGGAWTEITEFADGSVAAGNGVGSMKVGAWYRDFAESTDDDNVVVTLSATPNIWSGVLITLQKGAGETWDTPSFATAAWPSSSAQTVSASSTVTVPSSGIVLALLGIRDDSATFTRTTTSISEGGGIVTWNGNHVELPSAHKTTVTGGDMAADTGYRLVTTGGAGVTLQAEATLSAAETGSVLWVVQGVTAAVARVPRFRPYTQLLAH